MFNADWQNRDKLGRLTSPGIGGGHSAITVNPDGVTIKVGPFDPGEYEIASDTPILAEQVSASTATAAGAPANLTPENELVAGAQDGFCVSSTEDGGSSDPTTAPDNYLILNNPTAAAATVKIRTRSRCR